GDVTERPNIARLIDRVQPLVDALRTRLIERPTQAARQELLWYEDLVLYLLYERARHEMHDAIERALATGSAPQRFAVWKRFLAEFEHYLHLPNVTLPSDHEPAHVFACYFQIRRAFAHIFQYIVGGSMPAAKLRAEVWHSIFTRDLRRYYRGLYQHMADYTTLVTGDSGTGKELVARAIGSSRYIPFDPEAQRFKEDFAGSFFALNPAALSPTLVESELFGHKRGAFTGAVSDRTGWLEACPPLGTVFLDEIGELEPAIQVKLLRVIQSRTFQRLGETATRTFHGKIIAATNRDLAHEMHEGRFRTDLYYRLCADLIHAPSLRAQLADRPEELARLVRFVAQRVAGEQGEQIAPEVVAWIERELGPDYPWPGNFRELEQCVRNVVIRGDYAPPRAEGMDMGPMERMCGALRAGEWSMDELMRHYCTLVYARCGSYVEAARRLGLDRRTVAARVDPELARQMDGRHD
ncbi:MAG: sigma 54-interacting transcriptional regulator, partial [Phycisphaeraceae bacterium]